MEATETLAALRQLLEASSLPQWRGEDRLEVSVVADTVDLALLRTLEAGEIYVDMDNAALQREFNEQRNGAVPVATVVKLHVPRTHGKLIVVPDLERLLAIPNLTTQEPFAYVLCGESMDSVVFSHVRGETTDGAPATIRHYHQAIDLWVVLSRKAQHVSMDSSLLFFGLRRTEICPGFSVGDFNDEIASSDIAAFIDNGDRPETREEILNSVLSEFLRDQAPSKAFRWLLRGSDIFARRLKEGLAIYLAENSPEKLAEEAKKSAMEFSEKLEKIIGGLEAKSLSIPAALLLAAKEVQQGAGPTTLNVIVAASAVIFGITMTLVHRSQATLLEMLATTIRGKRKEFEDKGLDADNPVLTNTYDGLMNRRNATLWGSRVMMWSSWVPAVGVAAAMWLSPLQALNPNAGKANAAASAESTGSAMPLPKGSSAQPSTNVPSATGGPAQP